jgi:hypothetical protein
MPNLAGLSSSGCQYQGKDAGCSHKERSRGSICLRHLLGGTRAGCAEMSAVILAMPAKIQRAAKQRQTKVELNARHSWMMEQKNKWEAETTDGVKYETNIMVVRLKEMARKKWPNEFPPLMITRMRCDIAEGRKLIEKRNAVKAWLASIGVDVVSVKDAEQALFAAFDNLA